MSTLQLKPSPIQILNQDVLNVSVEASQADLEFGEGNIIVDRHVAPLEGRKGCWGIDLQIRFCPIEGQEVPPYTGSIELLGFYKVHEGYTGDPERLIRITGASMLYGVAREMLSQITAHSTNGMLTLPSVSFFEESPKKRATKKAAKKTARKKSK